MDHIENAKQLELYVRGWRAIDNGKPDNEPFFITAFTEYLASVDEDNVEFDGNGAYFGKQIRILSGYNGWGSIWELEFEVAYSPEQIVVYSAHHNGFWSPPYLSLTADDGRFHRVQDALYKLLGRAFGLPVKL